MDAGGCEMIGALLVSLALQGQPTLSIHALQDVHAKSL